MTESSYAAHPGPRRVSNKGLLIAIASLLVFGVIYAIVVREYQVEGNLTVTDQSTATDAGFLVVADPIDFDARTDTLSVRFEFDVTDSDLLDDGNRLAQGIRVIVYGADGTHEVKFPEGEPIGNAEIDMGVSGEVYSYPLDKYTGFIAVAAETFERGTGGVSETTGTVPVALNVAGSISGWDLKAAVIEEADNPIAIVNLQRAFSTRAFAVVLLAMAATVAVLALIAALMTVTNRRRFEVALLTWNGAILFSLPLLRTYLPGSPPIGAAMDIYVYLWIFVFAVISLVLMLIAWSEQRKADLIEERAKLGAS